MDTQYSFETRVEDMLALIIQKLDDATARIDDHDEEIRGTRKTVRKAGEILTKI
jgi:hypothetical protein